MIILPETHHFNWVSSRIIPNPQKEQIEGLSRKDKMKLEMWFEDYENRTGSKTYELVGQPQFKYKNILNW